MSATNGAGIRLRNVLIGVLAALLLAVVLNPGKRRHDEALRDKVAQRSPIAGMLGLGRVMGWGTTYHSLGIASWTEANGRVLTVGAFGLVVARLPEDR